jgi:hypothetical protein
MKVHRIDVKFLTFEPVFGGRFNRVLEEKHNRLWSEFTTVFGAKKARECSGGRRPGLSMISYRGF